MKLWAVLLLVGALVAVASGADSEPAAANHQHLDDPYTSPKLDATDAVYLQEHFDDIEAVNRRWIRSASKKAVDPAGEDVAAAEAVAKYDGEWSVEAAQRPIFRNDLGLVLKSKAKHAAIAVPLERPFHFGHLPLVLQYEVQLHDGQTCGGSYVKLLTAAKGGAAPQLGAFNDQTPYTIMFGPDKCGNDVKLHFIFRHVNPLTGAVEEKHCRKAKERLEEPFKDKQPHLYTLVVRPDNTYTIRVDRRVVNEGSLLVDFTPPVNPEREIDDATDSKPSDWDEREKIADPQAEKPADWDEEAPAQIVDATATKPDGWLDDEEELVADPTAVKPDDWDTEMDGEWEPPLVENEVCTKAVGCGLWKAPLIANPAYRGKWLAPLVDNPNYRGKWAPRRIPNPDWFEDLQPARTLAAIDAVGFELWSMSGDILFDNILVTHDEELADQWAAQSYDLKRSKIDSEAESFVERILKYANENPIMYAVFLIFVGLPITFIMYFCCKSAPEKPYESTLNRNKKSDLNQEDDEEADEHVEDSGDVDADADGDDETAEADAQEAAAAADDNEPETSPANTTGESLKSTGSGYSLRNRKKPSAAAAKGAEDETPASDSASESAGATSNDDEVAEVAEEVAKSSPPKPKAVETEARKRLRPRKE